MSGNTVFFIIIYVTTPLVDKILYAMKDIWNSYDEFKVASNDAINFYNYVMHCVKFSYGKSLAEKKVNRALDIGCGAGDLTKLLLGHAEKVDGVDLSPGLITKAKAKDELADISFHCNNFLDYNPAEQYDFISAIWFHHQLNTREEQEKARIKINQLLNKQGKFVFLIPSATYSGARASEFLRGLNFYHVVIDSCPEYDQMLFSFNSTEWEKYTIWRPSTFMNCIKITLS